MPDYRRYYVRSTVNLWIDRPLVVRIASVLSLAACLGGLPTPAAAEKGITVSGTGEVLARPTHVEIDLSAGATAELTADAIQKYRDTLRRTTEAFKKLDMKNLTIEERELSFANSTPGGNAAMAFAVPGGGAPAAKPQVDITRSLRLMLAGIDQLEESALMETIGSLIDTARDSGAAVGQGSSNGLLARMIGQQSSSTSMVTFVVDNASEQHEKAYQQAFSEAKSRASRLAKLAGTALGPVVSIEETAEAPKDDTSMQEQMIMAMYGGIGAKSKGGIRLTSEKLGDVPVRVTLRVRFSLGPQDDHGPDDEGDSK